MYLQIQLLSILYMCCAGIVFSFLYSFKQVLMISLNSFKLRLFIDTSFNSLFILLAYQGLYKLNDGILNMYMFIFFITFVLAYYYFLYPVLVCHFYKVNKFLLPFYQFCRILILRVNRILYMKKRRKHNGKKENPSN